MVKNTIAGNKILSKMIIEKWRIMRYSKDNGIV